jgi:excisionase family DNA binding protein
MKRDKYWTVSDIARALEVSPSTVRRLIVEREVPVMKLKRAWRVEAVEAARLIGEVRRGL